MREGNLHDRRTLGKYFFEKNRIFQMLHTIQLLDFFRPDTYTTKKPRPGQ